MSMNYDAPGAVRELEKMLRNFTNRNGYEINQVFDDTLRYIIWGFSLDGKPLENWRYNKEQNSFFWEYLKEWHKVMEKQLRLHDWYDPFGDIYMSCVAGNCRQSDHGQFFTPMPICDLMAAINGNNREKKTGITCSDPTCGSGRSLIAWHVRNLGNYLCAEDIDKTCCLMTCCNFIIHGCIGEVIWHDSLNPDSYNYGWKINEYLSAQGKPSIRSIKKEESRIWRGWQERKNNFTTEQNKLKLDKKQEEIDQNPNKNPIQLSLF